MNTKDFDQVAESAFQEYTAELSKDKAVEEYRQQLLKAVEEKMAALHNSEQDGEIPNAKIEAFNEIKELLKAKDNMEN